MWDLADFWVYRYHYGYQHFPSLLCSEKAASVTDRAYRWRSWTPFTMALSSKQEWEESWHKTVRLQRSNFTTYYCKREDRKKGRAQIILSNITKEPPTKRNANINWSLLSISCSMARIASQNHLSNRDMSPAVLQCSDSAHKAVLAACSQIPTFPISRLTCCHFLLLIFSQRAPLAILQQSCSHQEPRSPRLFFFFLIVDIFHLKGKTFSSSNVEKNCTFGKVTAAGMKLNKTSLQCTAKQLPISC